VFFFFFFSFFFFLFSFFFVLFRPSSVVSFSFSRRIPTRAVASTHRHIAAGESRSERARAAPCARSKHSCSPHLIPLFPAPPPLRVRPPQTASRGPDGARSPPAPGNSPALLVANITACPLRLRRIDLAADQISADPASPRTQPGRFFLRFARLFLGHRRCGAWRVAAGGGDAASEMAAARMKRTLPSIALLCPSTPCTLLCICTGIISLPRFQRTRRPITRRTKQNFFRCRQNPSGSTITQSDRTPRGTKKRSKSALF